MHCAGFTSSAELGVYITCIFLGIAMMMPLNALTSAPRYMVDYYKYVTGNPDAVPNSTVFWANILTFYNLASVVTQIIVGPTVLLPCMRKLSLTQRFIGALFLMMVEVFVVLMMPVGNGTSQAGAIAGFIVVTMGAGAGKSYLEATSYVLASNFPPKFMSAVMFGCGFSGVIMSTLQCIIKASMPDTYESTLKQAYIYFSLALAFMTTAMICVISLRFNSYAQEHVGEYRQLRKCRELEAHESSSDPYYDASRSITDQHDHEVNVSEIRVSRSAGTPLEEDVFGDVVLDNYQGRDNASERCGKEVQLDDDEVRVVTQGTNGGVQVAEMTDEDKSEDQQNMTTAEQLQHTRVWPIVKLIYPMQIACFCTFFVSLFIFPSLIIPIDRTSNWFSTIAVLLYNCGDATGRFSSSFKFLWVPRKVLVIVSFCRFLFLPLIFLCIYGYIPGHVAPFIFIAFIGLSNGFFGASAMVYGPNTPGLTTAGQKAMAGQLMGISLLAGASVASLVAILVVLFLPK